LVKNSMMYFMDGPLANKFVSHSPTPIYIYSFILHISIVSLQVHYYSEALLTTALMLCQSKHTEALQATEGLA